jgi:2-dehydropantoate 2-reductase
MKIIILGAGRIGSVFAFHLSLAGHEVTVVARGARLDALKRDNGIVTIEERRAPAAAVSAIDPTMPYGLVIVTVPEHQVEALLPQLEKSAAKTILLMFNTFYGTARYRDSLGSDRLTAGFPNMKAFLENDRLSHKIDGPGMVTTLSRPDLAAIFKEAGLPTEVEPDMDAFLRSHVVMTVPFFVAGLWTWQRTEELTWAEASKLTLAFKEGMKVVRDMGHALRPRFLTVLLHMPSPILTAAVWQFSRSPLVRDLGEFGPAETRWLIDAIAKLSASGTPHLIAIRP